MPNQRIVIFNFTGKMKDLPKALDEAIEEIEKKLEEPMPELSKLTLASMYGTFRQPTEAEEKYFDTDSVSEPKSLKEILNSIYGENRIEPAPDCSECPDKDACETLNKIILNDPMYGEYLRSIFDPRD